MLYVIATPIGNFEDITVRAKHILDTCDLVIGEEHRVTSTLLKKIGVEQKEIYLLNEHSKPKEIVELADLCAEKTVALVSDCGTPGFADPGPALVRLCRERKIKMTALPGASALTTLLSLTSEPVKRFVFFGFLPQDATERERSLQELKAERQAWIVMDTPYRLISTLEQMSSVFGPNDRALLGLNLTQPEESILEGNLANILKQVRELAERATSASEGEGKKSKFTAEFMLLKYAKLK